MRSKRMRLVGAAAGLALLLAAVVATAIAGSGRNARGQLVGAQEVPAVSTGASGTFTARIARDSDRIDWRLDYRGLESDATQAHVHFGQRDVNGGISVWLCSNLASPPTPAGVAPCPLREGTVTGTATAANVVGPGGQGIAPGEFGELVAAIRAGLAYANVHSVDRPGGEIRAQLRSGGGGDDDDD